MSCTIKETTFTSRTDSQNSMTINLFTTGYDTFVKNFKDVFRDSLNSCKLIIHYFSKQTITRKIAIYGLLNWDGVPVKDITISFDLDTDRIRNIEANYFTFFSENSLSDLEKIEDKSYNPYLCATQTIQYENTHSLFVYYGNAVKHYQHIAQNTILVTLGIYLKKVTPKRNKSTVIPLLVKDEFKVNTLNASCHNTKIKELTAIDDHTWTIHSPTFLSSNNDYVVEKITFYRNHTDSTIDEWDKIVIKLAGEKIDAEDLACIAFEATEKNADPCNLTSFVINNEMITANENNEITITTCRIQEI